MMGKNMPRGMVVRLPREKKCLLIVLVENVENLAISLHFRPKQSEDTFFHEANAPPYHAAYFSPSSGRVSTNLPPK
jgi:hypothetical protein